MTIGNFEKCRTCGEYDWLGGSARHRCNPIFTVWNAGLDETEDGGIKQHAADAETAAEKWAEWWDQDDHPLASGGVERVHVRSPDGSLSVWQVGGEAVVEYHAIEVHPDRECQHVREATRDWARPNRCTKAKEHKGRHRDDLNAIGWENLDEALALVADAPRFAVAFVSWDVLIRLCHEALPVRFDTWAAAEAAGFGDCDEIRTWLADGLPVLALPGGVRRADVVAAIEAASVTPGVPHFDPVDGGDT